MRDLALRHGQPGVPQVPWRRPRFRVVPVTARAVPRPGPCFAGGVLRGSGCPLLARGIPNRVPPAGPCLPWVRPMPSVVVWRLPLLWVSRLRLCPWDRGCCWQGCFRVWWAWRRAHPGQRARRQGALRAWGAPRRWSRAGARCPGLRRGGLRSASEATPRWHARWEGNPRKGSTRKTLCWGCSHHFGQGAVSRRREHRQSAQGLVRRTTTRHQTPRGQTRLPILRAPTPGASIPSVTTRARTAHRPPQPRMVAEVAS